MSAADFSQGLSLFRFRGTHRQGWPAAAGMTLLLRQVRRWRRRARDRAALARMGRRALLDLGVPDPDIAWQEARQPFWRCAQAAWREIGAMRQARTASGAAAADRSV